MSEPKSGIEISWIGLDGFLVVLYFIFVGVIFFAIYTRNDFIVGKLIPYGFMTAVTLIFINYVSMLFKFSKPKDKK